GVTAAIPDAIETMMVNAAMFTWSMDSSTAPILKNSTMVTVLDRKFVMMMASRNSTAMIPNCGRPPSTGCSTLPSHTLIPVASEDRGTAKQDTVPAKSRGGQGTC